MISELAITQIKLLKQFKNFEYFYNENEAGWEYNYYDKHVKGEHKNEKPTFNPLGNIVFYSTSRQYDFYSLTNVLHIRRGILLTETCYDVLKDFNLAPHIVYRGIKRSHKDIEYKDLVFIYFYNDFAQNIDHKSSIYWILKQGFDTHDRSKESLQDYVIEDNINCQDFNDWQEKRINIFKEKRHYLDIKYLICPDITEFDMFGFQSFNSGIFISNKLKKALLNSKVKGLDFAQNIYFKFGM